MLRFSERTRSGMSPLLWQLIHCRLALTFPVITAGSGRSLCVSSHLLFFLLTLNLFFPQRSKDPSTLYQLIEGATLSHLTVVNDKQLLSSSDGAQSVRNSD